jgi:hypothetical protein
MKWTNKGHEFDHIGKNFENVEHIYIYGCGFRGTELFNRMSYLDVVTGFIDARADEFPDGYMGKPVIPQHEFLKLKRKNIIVIFAMDNYANVKKTLICEGFSEGINLFDDRTFLEFYINIYYWYRHNKLWVGKITNIITTKCSLKCKHCSIIPLKKRLGILNKDYNEVMNELKLFFNIFDFIEYINIAGGETFLYPQLDDIINFFLENHADNFKTLIINTNGLFPPLKKELIKTMQKYCNRILVHYSDYTHALTSNQTQAINENIKYLKEAGIWIVHVISNNWSDFFYGINEEESDDELKAKYNNCNVPVMSRTIMLEHFAPCGRVLFDENTTGCLSIKNETNKVLFLEMGLGFSEKGYTEYCRNCAGHGVTYKNRVIPGVQL